MNFQGCFKVVQLMFHVCFKDVSRKLQHECFKGVEKEVSKVFKGFSGKFQGIFKGFLGSLGCVLKVLSIVFQRSLMGVSRKFQGCIFVL